MQSTRAIAAGTCSFANSRRVLPLRADHSEAKLLNKYLSYDCLLIDEIGYAEVEPVQVGLFFTLMHKRHRKKPTLITSNLGFTEWGSFLKNDSPDGRPH